jgi:hypothetical protein
MISLFSMECHLRYTSSDLPHLYLFNQHPNWYGPASSSACHASSPHKARNFNSAAFRLPFAVCRPLSDERCNGSPRRSKLERVLKRKCLVILWALRESFGPSILARVRICSLRNCRNGPSSSPLSNRLKLINYLFGAAACSSR